MPIFFGTIVMSLSRPGMRSCLPARLGTLLVTMCLVALAYGAIAVGAKVSTSTSAATEQYCPATSQSGGTVLMPPPGDCGHPKTK